MKRFTALLLGLLFLFSCAMGEGYKFTVYHGDRNDNRICITVDDCKDTQQLKLIFDLGQELGIPITFFTLGYVLLEEDAEIWRAVAESDCEIGNHGYWHDSLPEMSKSGMQNAMLRTQETLDAVLGYHYPMQVMRPPYGNVRIGSGSSEPLRLALQEIGYPHAVLWDVSQTDPSKCIHDVQNGSILLFHTIKKDYECLKVLLPQLIEKGFEFVTVSEMLGLPPVEISDELYVRDYIKK